MRRFGIVATCWQGEVGCPGRRRRSSPERRPMAIANRDAGSRRRPRQDLGAITSQKVVAQGDQLTRLNKQLRDKLRT